MRYLSWIVTLPVALVAVLFAISNRESVTFALWPLPFTMEAPLYLATLAALVAGFVCGGAVVWLSQGRRRRIARKAKAHALRLEREIDSIGRRAADAEERSLAAEARADELSRRIEEAGNQVAVVTEPSPRSNVPTIH